MPVHGSTHVSANKELIMKYFGTVDSFDTVAGNGQIKPETGGNMIRFETTAILWDKKVAPIKGQRLSYDVGSEDRKSTRLNSSHSQISYAVFCLKKKKKKRK